MAFLNANATEHINGSHPQALVHGWVDSPRDRGSVDIIWSNLSTILVCAWVMLHLNLPAAGEGERNKIRRRLKWFILSVLAPELTMGIAGGQWCSAKRSVKDMAQLEVTKEQWTMTHAFFADAGGFVLDTPDAPPFPVTAKQIAYLVRHKYMAAPDVTRDAIWDKSKADRFAKLVAVVQTTYFVAVLITRAVQRLPLCLLELLTVSLVACFAATFFFWFKKPLGVEIPAILKIDTPIATIRLHDRERQGTPRLRNGDLPQSSVQPQGMTKQQTDHLEEEPTPLDFIEPNVYMTAQLPGLRRQAVSGSPLPRLPNDRDPLFHTFRIVATGGLLTVAFEGMPFIMWDYHFPTIIERDIWRWNCVSMFAVLSAWGFIEVGRMIKVKYTESLIDAFGSYKTRWPGVLLFYVPGSLYFVARFIVIGEVAASFRALPRGCYTEVDWSNWIPHI